MMKRYDQPSIPSTFYTGKYLDSYLEIFEALKIWMLSMDLSVTRGENGYLFL